MSGGYFDHKQYELTYISDSIRDIIESNDSTHVNSWGSAVGRGYSEATLTRLMECVGFLHIAKIYTHRIDWLLSGDDGEDSFHVRLNTELAELGLGPEDDTPSPPEWTRTADQAPQRNDGDERGMVWVDDGLQVTTCRWDKVTAPYWQPRAPRTKPGRAERM
jgi:hypothetical protein